MKLGFVPPYDKSYFSEKANTRRFTRRQILKYSERVVKEIVFELRLLRRQVILEQDMEQYVQVVDSCHGSVSQKSVYILSIVFSVHAFSLIQTRVCVPIPLGALVLYASGMRDGAAAYFFYLIQKEKERRRYC